MNTNNGHAIDHIEPNDGVEPNSDHLIEYERNHNTSFFFCRLCHTHIALYEEYIDTFLGFAHGLFDNLVNVDLNPDYEIGNNHCTLRSVYCKNCTRFLGFILINLEPEIGEIRVGRHVMLMNKLFLWSGSSVLYADTWEPVRNGFH